MLTIVLHTSVQCSGCAG